jgi:adenylate cyclase
MSEPASAAASGAGPRWKTVLVRLRRPVVGLAAVGAVLGGLAGYVTVYRTVAGTPPAAPATAAATGEATEAISILVLPLANQTGDPARAYMADALTTAITADLSRIQDAVIVPAVTAVALQKKELTLQQLGSEARVRFVLQGAVGLSGERLRVHAQLSDTRSGRQLWTQVFETPMGDLFALQDDLTLRIRTSVGPQMVLVAAREARSRENEPRVADLLLRLRALDLQQQSVAVHDEREALARRILALEPTNVRARAALATALWLRAQAFGMTLGQDRARRAAQLAVAAAEAQQVLAVDPDHWVMLSVLASEAAARQDFDAARRHFERAVEIDPKNWAALNNLAWLLGVELGRSEEARALFLKALEIPRYLPKAETYAGLCNTSMALGAVDEAVEWGLKAVQAGPDAAFTRACLAIAYAMRGDERHARAATAELLRRHPAFRLDPISANVPWPGREAAYRDYMDRKFSPAVRLAGLPGHE